MAFTKGDWTFATDGHYFYITAPDKPNRPRKGIARIRDDNPEALANAHLIAAAPSLYEALKLTRNNLQTLSVAALHYKKTFSANLEILNQALALADKK